MTEVRLGEAVSRIEAVVQVDGGAFLEFEGPFEVVEARRPDEVFDAISCVDALTRERGCYAVGFVAYEAAAASGLAVSESATDLPLVWFGLFSADAVRRVSALPLTGDYQVSALGPSVDFDHFETRFRCIKRHLADGDSYQLNYTFPLQGRFAGNPRALFADLVAAQQGRYSAFVHTGRHSICSASPEMFLARDGDSLRARPMKGTTVRGRTPAEDDRQRDALCASEKQRAENVMVVDMVRSDLGRIAVTGSVEVPELFVAERYPHIWQMTSLVTARSRAGLAQIFDAMHPSASVTGAPKVRAMEILRGLERGPRGVYTGTVGYIGPGGSARFNVAIRTAVVDHAIGALEFGVGSGVVWDSEAAEEYEECLLKGSILGRRPSSFELLETLRWSPDRGFLLLDRHVGRARESAEYFGFACRPAELRVALSRAVEGGREPLKVRLLLSRDGGVRVESTPISTGQLPLNVALAEAPIDSGDPFMFHKTTSREVYEQAVVPDCDETILWNELGEVTEATTANIVVEVGGRLVTPPVQSGLLAGTYRAELLARGDVDERIVTIDELLQARRFWLVNSVHEWRPAVLAGGSRLVAGGPDGPSIDRPTKR